MIFLSAQPDTYYFTWQLELQIFNLNSLGISPSDIHILVGYKPALGLEQHFKELMSRMGHKASFYAYPDNRFMPKYASSIRPHIILQHFQQYPKLEQETIFYHDSDILFRELPDFSGMLANDKWYVSDTRVYLDSRYVRSFGGEALLSEMCNIIGVEPEKVVAQDPHCGGAQYLLKNTTVQFWQKLEKDCERLYTFMNEFNARSVDFAEKNKKNNTIQAWCADMWGLLWNAIYYEKTVEIHAELDFCWADTSIQNWRKKKILHYTGSVEKDNSKLFRKTNYSEYYPFYDLGLNKIDPASCSAALVEIIKKYVSELEPSRIDLSDTLLFIVLNHEEGASMEILTMQLRYLEKFFTANIYIIETGPIQLYNEITGLKRYGYKFFPANSKMNIRDIVCHIVQQSNSTILGFIYGNAFLSTDQYLEVVQKIRDNANYIVTTNTSTEFNVGIHFQSIFDKCLDPKLLTLNKKKFNSYPPHGFRGVFFSTQNFLTNKNKYWGNSNNTFSISKMVNGFNFGQLADPHYYFSGGKFVET